MGFLKKLFKRPTEMVECTHCGMKMEGKPVEMFGKKFCSEDHAYEYMTAD